VSDRSGTDAASPGENAIQTLVNGAFPGFVHRCSIQTLTGQLLEVHVAAPDVSLSDNRTR